MTMIKESNDICVYRNPSKIGCHGVTGIANLLRDDKYEHSLLESYENSITSYVSRVVKQHGIYQTNELCPCGILQLEVNFIRV